MQSGKLKHRLTLQKYSYTRDAAGDVIPVWTEIAQVYAKVEGVQPGDGQVTHTAHQLRCLVAGMLARDAGFDAEQRGGHALALVELGLADGGFGVVYGHGCSP